MRSILLAIGCDEYYSLSSLSGAEADARKVFDALTGPGQPYGKNESRLLLSPTKTKLEQTLAEICTGEIDVLTFYFAGHGGAKGGGYYFCLKDSHVDCLALTAYPLNAWLNLVKELQPRYTYLVLDSCNSGGTHHDIRELLHDPRLGQHSASTFACLAAASADQYASEVNGAGIMTAELLKVLDGRLKIGSDQEELDLTEIARAVGRQFAKIADQQRPVAWGLNLFGPGHFCRNPHFLRSTTVFHLPEVLPESELARRMATHSNELWAAYRDAANGVNVESIRDLIARVSGGAEISPADRSVFVFGLAQAVVSRMESRGTPWEEAELFGIFAASLLRDVRIDATAARIAGELINRKIQLELDLIQPTLESLSKDPWHLLSRDAGMADFFYLPLRLLKLLATVAHASVIAPTLGLQVDLEITRSLVDQVIVSYPLAFRSVSDDQAPAMYIWSAFAKQLGWVEQLEKIFGSMLSDFIAAKGKVARCDLPPAQACEYILARGVEASPYVLGWLANPSHLLAVLLLVGTRNDLDESIDGFLEVIDHERSNFYLPRDYLSFVDAVMDEGVNRTHEIGHDIWTCDDFRRFFVSEWQSHIAADKFPASSLEQILITCAALAYPDRVPLCLEPR